MPSAGDLVHASDAVPDDWTSYTPSWSTSGTAPSLGNGSITGRWLRVGGLVWVNIKFQAGSTTSFGSGNWRFTLPVAPAVDDGIPGFANDNSAGTRISLFARFISSSTSGDNMRIATGGLSSGVSNTVPFTWATSDVLVLSGSYKPA